MRGATKKPYKSRGYAAWPGRGMLVRGIAGCVSGFPPEFTPVKTGTRMTAEVFWIHFFAGIMVGVFWIPAVEFILVLVFIERNYSESLNGEYVRLQ